MLKLGRKFKFLVLCSIFICTINFVSFADTVEIKNGIKTTYAEKARLIVDTIDKHYDFKWALDKKGDWRLYIRNINGRIINLSNLWVNMERTSVDENGVVENVIDYYYFDYYQKMVTGWYVEPNGVTYYFNTDPSELGRMARGWCKIGDDYYYFSQSGELQRNIITVDGFYVDGNGKWK